MNGDDNDQTSDNVHWSGRPGGAGPDFEAYNESNEISPAKALFWVLYIILFFMAVVTAVIYWIRWLF